MESKRPLMANIVMLPTDTVISTFGLNDNISLRNKLINVCIHIRHYTYKRALKTFFTLFYGSRIEREAIIYGLFRNIEFSDLDASPDNTKENFREFSEEEIQVLSNEFLYQYTEANPEFMMLEEHPEYQNELDSLRTAMNNAPVLFFRAVKQCELICHLDSIVSNCLSYLLSEDTTSHMCGLAELGHNFQHRVLLLPYAKQIGILLKAMHKAKNSGVNRISPFEIWLNQHEEEEFVSKSTTELPKVLLLDELVKFSELIRSLPRSKDLENCFHKLTIDSKLLLNSKEYQELVKAIVILLYRNQTYLESLADFSMGDTESMYTFYKSRKALANANELYNNALDTFLAFCKT